MAEQPEERTTIREAVQASTAAGGENQPGFSKNDIADIEDSSRLRAPMIYEIVRREGEEEMARPASSLWWSGLGAGLSISFSLVTQGVLQLHTPNAPWRPLITGFGYSVGFLLVILARQQLFTENTVTAVLPVTVSVTLLNVARLIRLWSIVLAANLTGTLFAALFCSFTPVLPPALPGAMLDLSAEMMRNPPLAMFFKAIAAGYLIAAMVWLIPSAEGAKFLVITLLTYIIAIAGFTHVVAGSFEAFMLVVNGQPEVSRMIVGFLIPVLFRDVVGGTVLFALISYAQLAKEV